MPKIAPVISTKLIFLVFALSFLSVSLVFSQTADERSLGEITLRTQLAQFIYTMDVHDDIAFVGMGHHLEIYDVSNGEEPVLLHRSEPFDKIIYALTFHNDTLYIVSEDEFTIVDVSDITNPRTVSTQPRERSSAGEIVIKDDIALVVTSYAGLTVWDISDLSTPSIVNTYPDIKGQEISLAQDVAYIARGDEGLAVVDMSQSSSEPSVMIIPYDDNILDIEIFEETALVSVSSGITASVSYAIKLYDISTTTNPVEIATYTLDEDRGIDIELFGETIYGVTCDEMYIFDFNFSSISVSSAGHVPWGGCRFPTLTVTDETVYTTGVSNGFNIIDVTQPETPTLLWRQEIPMGISVEVEVIDDRLYVNDTRGLVAIDVSDIDAPSFTASSYDPADPFAEPRANIHEFEVIDDLIFGAYSNYSLGEGGFHVFEQTDSAITLIHSYSDASAVPYHIEVVDNIVYLSTDGGGLYIFDVTAPQSPTLLSIFQPTTVFGDVFVVDGLAYLAGYFTDTEERNRLTVVDVSQPTNPTWVAEHDISGLGRDIAVIDNHLIAVMNSSFSIFDLDHVYLPPYYEFEEVMNSGLSIFDLDQSAQLIGHVDTFGLMTGLDVVGEIAYVTNADSLVTIDISDRTNPTILDEFDTHDVSGDVAVVGETAYVPSAAGGIYIFDVNQTVNVTDNVTDDAYYVYLPALLEQR